MALVLPEVKKLIHGINKNEIWQYFGKKSTLDGYQFVTSNPFVIEFDGSHYLLTSKIDDENVDAYEYILLTSKKPTRRLLDNNEIIIKRWLKHPTFETLTPDQVVTSWTGEFKFKKENEEEGIKGLRPPQVGALHSILAHLQNSDDKAIIVMPTGTGKTETMLSTLIANECKKLLVSVPSDSLRNQISDKFITLGLLKEFGIIGSECKYPIVGIVKSGFSNTQEWREFIEQCNVVISTMDILSRSSTDTKSALKESFSQFFVDEAHHAEARTWKELIEKFDSEKIFLFTATPFRNDGKSLKGKVIFNFSLRNAQEQKYYKQINYLPIREYNKKTADKKIADKAVGQLRADIDAGYSHILMARCMSKARAIEVYKYYSEHEDLNPVLVYTGVAGLSKKIDAIKSREHLIIVCVNMLGEGFDLPNLKIAAIHDERQSLPITLQFIGRFTRSSYDELGNASFITNIAYPPIHEELDQLYARNADWNLLLPRMSENATQKEINIKEFLDGFHYINESEVPFAEINPAMSTVIYKNNSNEWNPSNWQDGFPHIESYEHVFSDTNHRDTLVIILGKIERVEWGNFETVQNLHWDIVIIHWDLRPDINRVFLNTSFKNLSSQSLLDSIFGENNTSVIKGMNVFRIYHNVNRLTLFSVGTRRGFGQDITFQSYYGRGVQDGIRELEQGSLIKNNIFGIGYKQGEKISLGCSVKGKIWSYQRGNLDELTKWCKAIGEIVENEEIDPNVVLRHTLAIERISERPQVMPILIDWHHSMYEYSEERYQFTIAGNEFEMSDVELNILNPTIRENIQFSLDTPQHSIHFETLIAENAETNESYFEVRQLSPEVCSAQYGTQNNPIIEFFQEFTPTFWFSDGSQLLQNLYVKLKESPDLLPLDSIITDDWNGVDIGKESQDIAPYIQDSIQFYFINKIRPDFQIIYDDDGTGEIADIIGINDKEDEIDIHLFHLKYASGSQVNNSIQNFYQVCGQAQKSLKWKYREGRDFFNHLFKRQIKNLNGNSCSRIIKGTEEDLENLLDQAKFTKPMKFTIYIVQPSLSKANASHDILLLLGNVHHYLSTVGNIDLKVYTSQ